MERFGNANLLSFLIIVFGLSCMPVGGEEGGLGNLLRSLSKIFSAELFRIRDKGATAGSSGSSKGIVLAVWSFSCRLLGTFFLPKESGATMSSSTPFEVSFLLKDNGATVSSLDGSKCDPLLIASLSHCAFGGLGVGT